MNTATFEISQTKIATPAPSGVLQRNCACGQQTGGGGCSACERKRLSLQRSTRDAEHDTRNSNEVPPIVHEVLRSPGQPLDFATRSFFEPRFGHDFSHVRVHTDAKAAESAWSVNALAYTVGPNIVFGPGQFAPSTSAGQKLIAHELTHVAQQPVTTSRGTIEIGKPDTLYEREADRVSDRIGAASYSASYSRTLSRAPANIIQRVAPAVGIGALAARCIVGAIIGALFDLAIHAGTHMWRIGEWSLSGMRVDYCSVIISAVLGCIGGVVVARWLAPWITNALGPRLGGIAGSLLGRILLFIASRLPVAVPKWIVGRLARLGCISNEQAEALYPGISRELLASGDTDQSGPATAATG